MTQKSYEELQKELRQWAKTRGLAKIRNRDEYRLVLAGTDEEFRYAQFFFDIQLIKGKGGEGIHNARITANGWNPGNTFLMKGMFGLEDAYDDNDCTICLANVVTPFRNNTPDGCLEGAIAIAKEAACMLVGVKDIGSLNFYNSGIMPQYHYGIGHFIRDLREILKGKSVKEICRDE